MKKQTIKLIALIKARLQAYDYKFYEKAGTLCLADEGSEEQEPGFGLKEAMEAAAAMADIIFPTSHLTNDPKQLTHHV